MTLPNQLDLKIFPDRSLTLKAAPVTEFDEDLNIIIVAMLGVMKKAEGVGLAAPQIGISKRIITYNINEDEGYMVNPEIIWTSEEKQEMKEGCLSFPGVFIAVDRFKEVKVKYFDSNQVEKELHAEGFHAQMIQHEVEHLDGIVFTSYISNLKRDLVKRKMVKFKKVNPRKAHQI